MSNGGGEAADAAVVAGCWCLPGPAGNVVTNIRD
jgi:hypothetical protein